jgi:predicted alpha/beta-hydrolase family hydrolase
MHLKHVRTPFLIIQGTRDEYGGSEIAGKYPLSPHTQLEWVDADHDFLIPDAEWARVLERIHEFFFAGPR